MIVLPETARFRPLLQSQPDLRPAEVNLWKASLGEMSKEMRCTLSADEWIRSSRFHFVVDRERYIATRAVVRRILGDYLGENPVDLQFTRGSQGKPALVEGGALLRFNLSHSDDLLLLAVAF